MGDPERTDDRERFATAVPDHANAVHAKEQGTAMFGMVKPLFDPFEIAAQKCGADLAPSTAWQFRSKHPEQNAANGFQKFQQNIAGEAIAHNNVEVTGEHIAALTVASEVKALLVAQEGVGAEGQFVAFTLLLPDVESL